MIVIDIPVCYLVCELTGNVIRELQNTVKNFKRRLQRIKGRLKSFKRNKEKREKSYLKYDL